MNVFKKLLNYIIKIIKDFDNNTEYSYLVELKFKILCSIFIAIIALFVNLYRLLFN